MNFHLISTLTVHDNYHLTPVLLIQLKKKGTAADSFISLRAH